MREEDNPADSDLRNSSTKAECPESITLQPDEYDLPSYITTNLRQYADRQKKPVTITAKQIEFFGQRGVPWEEIERFYNVDRTGIVRYFKVAYERGKANTNIELRNKMIDMALAGHPTMLIWVSKNRLGMSDNGLTNPGENDAGVEFSVKAPQMPDWLKPKE